ncbi:MAG: helix-turn-helix domain-containing protein [Oscillospiraceae bacterium]|nr:helix-turn-helix domain-containing protein [Oscillospiraceae bacterium]
MEIQEFRKLANMSQRQFASYFGIPLGTLRNWEQGIAKPPEYVLSMLIARVRRDKMINFETIKLMRLLEDLAVKTANGIKPFAEMNETNRDDFVFFQEVADEEGNFPVVLDAMVIDDPDCYHHDVISLCDSDTDEYTIRVVVDEVEGTYVRVRLALSFEEIVVEDGRWYIV